MAGEVVSVGEDVTNWKAGDRVCANFAPGHLSGGPTRASIKTGLGGQTHGVLTEIRAFPDNVRRSLDAIFGHNVGGQGTLRKSIASVHPAGHIHLIGFVSEGVSEAVGIVLNTIQNAITLRGVQIGSVAQFVDMNKLMSAHPETTRPFIDRVFPFEQAKEAYSYLISQAHVGKVVIQVASD
ncbi:hypothetical protein C0991_000575 [Blastosporella zonata]|nr:hypothetical protein C0991_000575 [Blastosporella zonata]